VHRLKAQARGVGYEWNQPGPEQRTGQKRTCEQPAYFGGGLSLEDQPGAHPHDAHLGSLAF
jgi:hypothetical protein